jgi:16S rRNA (cytidine1402-2'-O)-methyltransferase
MVATPIGNLKDLTQRASEVFSDVDEILCEDTRQTQKLLQVLGIKKRLRRLDAHATPKAFERVLSEMEEGRTFAFVTDAGTPGLSDPGGRLVKEAWKRDLLVCPIPGPSAVTALLSVAGWDHPHFSFRGFFPRKKKDQQRELALIQKEDEAHLVIWYESPKRIEKALSYLAGETPDLWAVAAKELTKLHEKVFFGSVQEVSQRVTQEIETEGERGEWCFALGFEKKEKRDESKESWLQAAECLFRAGVAPSEVVKNVSQVFKLPKNRIYDEVHQLEKKIQGKT